MDNVLWIIDPSNFNVYSVGGCWGSANGVFDSTWFLVS